MNDTDVLWERKGDFLHIKPPIQGQLKIDMTVEGSSNNRSFITHNSMSLLSSFPWYPIPGEYQIFQTNRGELSSMYYFKNISIPYNVEFNIKIENGLAVYSNLKKVGENIFTGNVSGVTLLSGNLTHENYEGKNIVTPTEFLPTIKKLLPQLGEKINQTTSTLGETPVDVPENIFVVPFYCGILNSFYLETSENQLFIDSQFLSHFTKGNTPIIDGESIVRCFYIMNQYRENEAFALRILPALVQDLHHSKGDNPLSIELLIKGIEIRKSKSEELLKLKCILSDILDLIKNQELEKVSKIINEFYREMELENGTLDVLKNLVERIKEGE